MLIGPPISGYQVLLDLKWQNPHELLAEHPTPELRFLLGNKPTANQVNLADVPQHASKKKELEELPNQEMKRVGDPYQLAD